MPLGTGTLGTAATTTKLPSFKGASPVSSLAFDEATGRGVDSAAGSTILGTPGDPVTHAPDPTGDTGEGYGSPTPTPAPTFTPDPTGDTGAGYGRPTIPAPTTSAGSIGVAYPDANAAADVYAAQQKAYYDALMNSMKTAGAGQNDLYALQQQFALQQYDWAANQAKEVYGYENQINNQNYMRANLNTDKNALDRDKLLAQQNLLGQQWGTGVDRYNTNAAGMDTGYNLDINQLDQNYQNDLNYIGQQYGFNSREFANAKQGLDLQYDKDRRMAISGAVAGGALSSRGFAQGLGEIGRTRDIGYNQAQLGWETNRAGLQHSEAGLNADYTGNRGNLTNDYNINKANLGFDFEDWSNQQQAQKANIETELKQNTLVGQQLHSIAQDLALNAEHMNAMFHYGLDKLGLDAHQAIAQLQQMMASNDENMKAQGAAMLAQILGIQ